ncbi:glutamine-hydrolyzing GMP synthase [Tardisphaera miroshnichenkoae]
MSEPKKEGEVLIVNFGGQYAHMITRRVRQLGVFSELVNPRDLTPSLVSSKNARAIILSGGPSSVYEPSAPAVDPWVFSTGLPTLGICYGFQLTAKLMGGDVSRGEGEYGPTKISVEPSPLFEGWERTEVVWMSHADMVTRPPPGARVVATSEKGYVAALEFGNRIYGVQFHPEVAHTPKGMTLLSNFLFSISGMKPSWNASSAVDAAVSEIKQKVKRGEKVFCAVSGGVDSTVSALIAKKAVGDDLITVFVDHGLLREGEAEEVMETLTRLGLKPKMVDASALFLSALKGISDPEEKRKVIGELFGEIFEDILSSDPSIRWLVQGTTYPDVIESGEQSLAERIKSHHNVAGLPPRLAKRVGLLEPLRYLYKDEVRAMARELGAADVAARQPFPGPGLAVRVIGEVTQEKLLIARKASKIVEDEVRASGVEAWQAFAVVGDDRWVGVKGDRREEGRIVTVRIVTSEDGMTADWARLPHDLIAKIANRIASEVPGVSMVTFAVSPKPPSTIEPC